MFVGALTARGFVAALMVAGAVNGELFRANVERVLAPELQPGYVVVLDKLGSHKVGGVQVAVGGAGGRSCICPYSPNLNLIELAFSKLKAVAAAERTVEAL